MHRTPRLTWTDGDLPLLVDPGAGGAGVAIAFSTRAGGVSRAPFDSLNLSPFIGDDATALTTNWRRLEAAAGFTPSSLRITRQVHGCTGTEADDGGSSGEGDFVIARRAGVTAGVLTADCVPILVAGDDAVGAIHAGWRGLVQGVVAAAIQAVGCVRHAWVGPSIHACCYEVGPEVTDAFRTAGLPVADASHVDPGRAAVVALRAAGVASITASLDCTSCDERFYSYRRDGVTGRQGGFIAWL